MIVRIPTQYNLHRADSGRLSSGLDDSDSDKKKSKVQQLQNVPRKIRDMMVALPGHRLVGADYSAIEWVVMMWYGWTLFKHAQFYKDLIDKHRARKLDPHTYLATFIYNVQQEKVNRAQRQNAKPYTYGYWENAISVGRRVGHLDTVAKAIGDAHERAFLMNPIRKRMLEMVKSQHYAETALGYRRYFWEWNPKPEEVFAHFGQGTAADILKSKLVILSQHYDWEIITNTHDNIVAMAPEKEAPEAARRLQETLESPVPFMNDLSFRVDVKDGMNWRAVS